jgi:muramoyltetrapeptide carboxypeptidase LdcA involved in peptidoglycan recycling
LIGWCIDVFPFLQGTAIWPTQKEWENKILVIETSEEKMETDTFERIIRNLWSQWILQQISWIILWRSQYDYDKKIQISYDASLLKIINQELWLINLPIITNMDFGHTDPICVLPLWCNAKIDCDKRTFSIIENACI